MGSWLHLKLLKQKFPGRLKIIQWQKRFSKRLIKLCRWWIPCFEYFIFKSISRAWLRQKIFNHCWRTVRNFQHRKFLLFEFNSSMFESYHGFVEIRKIFVGVVRHNRQGIRFINKRSESLVRILQVDPANVATSNQKRESVWPENSFKQQIPDVQWICPARCTRISPVPSRFNARRFEFRRTESFSTHRWRHEVSSLLLQKKWFTKKFLSATWKRQTRCGIGILSEKILLLKTSSSVSSRARCSVHIVKKLAWCMTLFGTFLCQFHQPRIANWINVLKCSLWKMFWTDTKCLIVM